MIRICTAHPLFYLARGDSSSARAIVKGHPLNVFDVLFFDSIIAKLTHGRIARHVHIAVSTQNCGIKRTRKEKRSFARVVIFTAHDVFIFRPRLANFTPALATYIFLCVRAPMTTHLASSPQLFKIG